MVELNVGIVNGCLPTLRPLFNARLRPSRGQVRLPENKDATYITPRVKLQSITRSLNPENYRELGATGYDAGSMHD